MNETSQECAREVLETVPMVMQAIRREMRAQRASASLSLPQFRTLVYLENHPGASLAQVAEHIGLTPPSMSRLIDGLVGQGLVRRRSHPRDRRRIELALTIKGDAVWQSARRAVHARLAERMDLFSAVQQRQVIGCMRMLRPVFTPGRPANSNPLGMAKR